VLRHGSHSFTCKLHHACLPFVSVHRMAPPLNVVATSNCSSLLIYRPRPGRLTYSGRLTHISGHPSATGRAQDGERMLAREWRSTAEPRRPPWAYASLAAFRHILVFSCYYFCFMFCWRIKYDDDDDDYHPLTVWSMLLCANLIGNVLNSFWTF